MATIEDFIDMDFSNQQFEFDSGMISALTLQVGIQNNIYLREVIKRQIQIQNILESGKATGDDAVNEYSEVIKDLNETTTFEFTRLLASTLKK